MKYIRQLLIILLVSFAGELLNYLIVLPIPASIYGMILMFILLCTGVIKIHQIKDVSKFLIDIMPLLFIPSAVGIMSQFEQLKNVWLEIILVTIMSTVVTMAVTGLVSQAVIRLKNNRKRGTGNNGCIN